MKTPDTPELSFRLLTVCRNGKGLTDCCTFSSRCKVTVGLLKYLSYAHWRGNRTDRNFLFIFPCGRLHRSVTRSLLWGTLREIYQISTYRLHTAVCARLKNADRYCTGFTTWSVNHTAIGKKRAYPEWKRSPRVICWINIEKSDAAQIISKYHWSDIKALRRKNTHISGPK